LSTDDARYRVGATLSLPLDRTNERLAVRSAQIRLERAERDHDRLTDNVVVESRAAVRAVEVARFQLNLAEQQVEINRRRLRGQKLQEDTLRPQDIVDTENELLQAENDRDRARTRLRSAVLAYLLSTDQLRVTRAGSLQALPFE
jgi:outer membrane protein TolC